jgi:uncharacterized membrane protein
MRAAVPVRPTAVWLTLVAATLLTWWLGTDHPFSDQSGRLAASIAIVVAFVKVTMVGWDFMDLRRAPTFLKSAFLSWLVVVGAACVLLYAL